MIDPLAPDTCGFRPLNPLCSDARVEPLPGTAKTGATFVIVEHPGPWSRDILDGGTFDVELTARLKTLPGLYLIRRPGREGHRVREKRTVYLAFFHEAVTEHLQVGDLEELCELDMRGPGRNGGEVVDTPPVLVCTHAKRDRCCAIKGRPIAQALAGAFPQAPVWEVSHTGGHRFAPSIMVLPWGYYFGHLNEKAAVAMYQSFVDGELFLPGNRGRGIHTPREQVAEMAVLGWLQERGEAPAPGALTVVGQAVTDPVTGRTWRVEIAESTADNILPSCGDKRKSTTVLRADAIIQTSGG